MEFRTEFFKSLKEWQILIAALIAVVGIPLGNYSALSIQDREKNKQLVESRVSLVTALRWEIYAITHKAEDFLASYKDRIEVSLSQDDADEESYSSITATKFIFWKNLREPKVFEGNLDKLGNLESGIVAKIMTFYTGLENMNLFMEMLVEITGEGDLTIAHAKTLHGIMSMLCKEGTEVGSTLDAYLKHYGVDTPKAGRVYDCGKSSSK